MNTITLGYTTCVAGVGADMIDVNVPGNPAGPEFVPGAMWIEIRIGKQAVRVPWTSGPPPDIGARVYITVEAAP